MNSETPQIKTEATRLQYLIDWSADIHEPVLTCDIQTDCLSNYLDKEMTVAKFPVHGKSIERCVQAVTRACGAVFGEDRRDGFIHAILAHRKLAPSLESKTGSKYSIVLNILFHLDRYILYI